MPAIAPRSSSSPKGRPRASDKLSASGRPDASRDAATRRAEQTQRVEELGRIIQTYVDVTDRLQQSHDQLQQTVESLRRDLAEKNRLLERKNRLAALGEMAAGLAHEIRNPLGGIQLYASLLGQDLVDQPESLQLVNKITGGVKHLDGLVTQVLQFSREMTASLVEADLASVVDGAVELATPRLQQLGVTCDCDGPRPLPARLDPRLMGQVVLNLLLNAAEALTPLEHRQITVRWSMGARVGADAGRHVRLSVRDTGPGIPADILDRIFNPFFTTKETGTGLGLAIVHRIIEAHDGTILASNPAGGGALFEVRW